MEGMKQHTMSITVADIRRIMDRAYPPQLAEKWDKNGLICGDPSNEVQRVAFALECDMAVVEAAEAAEAQMIIVHHPLLLKGVSSVAADTPKGAVLHRLIRSGIALFNAHTNADSARPGVNDHLCEILGLHPGRPLAPQSQGARDAWTVYFPLASSENVLPHLFKHGAGEIGNYCRCSFSSTGEGQFEPRPGADPTEGEIGVLHRGEEEKVEFIAPASRRREILAALREHHPYEEPAFHIVAMEEDAEADNAVGIGRIGLLPEPMRLGDFVQRVANTLPQTAWGVRATGDPEQLIQKVAVCSGSGDSFLDLVRGLDVDAYLTSDLRHHPVDEYLRAGGVPVIDTAHWASEFPWTSQAAELIGREAGVETIILDHRSDPWTMGAQRD